MYIKEQLVLIKVICQWVRANCICTGITKCIQRYPQLVQGQDQHLSKLKVFRLLQVNMSIYVYMYERTHTQSLLETIVNMQSTNTGQLGAVQRRFRNIQVPLLKSAPASFIDSIVHLAGELIVATYDVPQPRLR